MIGRIGEAVADLLWPNECGACGKRIPICENEGEIEKLLCPLCSRSAVLAEPPWCTKCGLPFEGKGPNHLCSTCKKNDPPFEWARSVFQYGGAVKEALQRFKYNGAAHLAGPFGKSMVKLISRIPNCDPQAFDLTIPLPLHSNKLKSRGFNQSALISGPVAAHLKAPISATTLIRVRETENQAGLTRKERIANVMGAFETRTPKKIERKKILLVDDVITSTATIREATDTLMDAGAGSVSVLSLARATGSDL